MVSAWQHTPSGGARVTHLVRGSFGLPLVGGNRAGRGVVMFSAPDDTSLGVVLEGGPLVALTHGASAVAVTADGSVHEITDPALGGQSMVRTERLPLAPSGAPPVMAWATTGDSEARLVLAYPAATGFELWIVGVGLAGELTPLGNTLVTRDLEGVRVTSHEGVVVVAGPVAETTQHAEGCRVWLCPDPDFGDASWEELTLDPTPEVVTDAADGSVWWWLGGRAAGTAAVWDQGLGMLETPVVPLDPAHPFTCVARGAVGERTLAVAVQSPSGPSLHWQEEDVWRTVELPAGRISRALWTAAYDQVPERVHVVVDGAHWSLEASQLG